MGEDVRTESACRAPTQQVTTGPSDTVAGAESYHRSRHPCTHLASTLYVTHPGRLYELGRQSLVFRTPAITLPGARV